MKSLRLHKVNRSIRSIQNSKTDDLFLVAASFEPRSIKASSLLTKNSVKKAVIFQYEDTLDSTLGVINTRKLKDLLKSAGVKKKDVLSCNFKDIYSVNKQFLLWLKNNPINTNHPNISIDITCFTKLHLLLLLKLLNESIPNVRLRIIYTEPLSYATAFGKTLSHGILDTVYLPFQSGRSTTDLSALILFLGHEHIRAEIIVEETEPDDIILVIGRPGFSPEMCRMSEKLNRCLLTRIKYDHQFHLAYTSTRDFWDIATFLFNLISYLYKSKKISTFYIAPLGTKLQVVGLFFALQNLDPNIRIVITYSIPKRYEKSSYSQGFGPTYSAILDLQLYPETINIQLENNQYSIKKDM